MTEKLSGSVLLSLGSNKAGHRRLLIDRACEEIVERIIGCRIIYRTTVYLTKATDRSQKDYRNELALVKIPLHMDCKTFISFCKELEREAGRDALSKKRGVIPLDIDVLMWYGKPVRQPLPVAPYLIGAASELILSV